VFVEPLETIELNNRLARMFEEEVREVRRVLAEMTERLREQAPSITTAIETIGRLEFLLAKGRFGREFRCCIPSFSEAPEQRLLLRRARHPLLESVLRDSGRKLVPLSIELNPERRVLVVSGPNAGGKTVVLKTVGLLALMAQAGLPVPADDAEFAWFDQVLTDIGDAQSISESLSTFSAHIEQVCRMMDSADARSLVLIDELGTATDPEEGGALGVAVADHFGRVGSLTIISTHLPALKTFAATTAGAANAAVGFDEQTLAPNYRLLVGVPGQSAGLAMAGRFGLPAAVIERAREVLDKRTEHVAALIRELQRQVDETEAERRELRAAQQELRERERKLEQDYQRRLGAKVHEFDTRIEQLIARFESEYHAAVERATQAGRKAAADSQQRFARGRRELREGLQKIASETGERPSARPDGERAGEIRAGATVRLGSLGASGRVLQKVSEDTWEVEVGRLRMRIRESEISEVLPSGPGMAPERGRVTVHRSGPTGAAATELNVIGRTSEDACNAVDKFLDDAVLAEAERVRVIHGHGKNILRGALWRMFASHPQVARYYQAEQHEGGAGATIVELKS
jgi:DNA mismatch repair protein MutS2